MLGTVGARAQNSSHPARLRVIVDKDIKPCHLTHPLQAFLPSGRIDHTHICMRTRLSAALHHSTLPGDEQSIEADWLHHIPVRHFMHIRYAP